MTLVAQCMVNELVHSPRVPFKDTCEYAGHMTNLRGVTKSLTSKQQMTNDFTCHFLKKYAV